jgi:alcohol dehydrogenase
MAAQSVTGAPNPNIGRRLPPDWHLAAFDQTPRTRLVFGNNSIERIGDLTAELGASRVLLVTDPGIVRAGHASRVRSLLLSRVSEVEWFADARENPDTDCVDACVAVAARFKPDAIIGLGGGSAMDTAKGCNFIHTNGGRMQDYWGVGKAMKPMLPFIAIPTTAGTGSECQSAALIADARTHMKMACLDPKAAAKIAILDPVLTVSQPQAVTAHTGFDAIAHAVETAVTARRNAISLMYSHEAFKLLVPSFPKVLRNPNDLEARGRMLLGAALAGTAIELSMLGAAHSAANPLTAHFNVVHGVAVGLMLPHIIRFNAADPDVRFAYAELASAPEIACVSEGHEEAVDALVRHLEVLLNVAGFPRSLEDAGVDPSFIPQMSVEAAKQWTAQFNPLPVQASDFEAFYRAACEPRAPGETL